MWTVRKIKIIHLQRKYYKIHLYINADFRYENFSFICVFTTNANSGGCKVRMCWVKISYLKTQQAQQRQLLLLQVKIVFLLGSINSSTIGQSSLWLWRKKLFYFIYLVKIDTLFIITVYVSHYPFSQKSLFAFLFYSFSFNLIVYNAYVLLLLRNAANLNIW